MVIERTSLEDQYEEFLAFVLEGNESSAKDTVEKYVSLKKYLKSC